MFFFKDGVEAESTFLLDAKQKHRSIYYRTVVHILRQKFSWSNVVVDIKQTKSYRQDKSHTDFVLNQWGKAMEAGVRTYGRPSCSQRIVELLGHECSVLCFVFKFHFVLTPSLVLFSVLRCLNLCYAISVSLVSSTQALNILFACLLE